MLVCAGYLHAQTDSLVVVTELKASINTNRVGITFTLGKGSFCYGAILERTTDTLNPEAYVPLGEIEGVCGDQYKPISYTLWDNEPITNKKVWYRVITGYIPTKFLEVEVPHFESENHAISPNPMSDFASIRLAPEENGTIRVAIFSPTGKLIRNTVVGSGNMARISKGTMQSGLYLYHIYLDDAFYASGKLVVR